jgi:hypothetical protein
MKDIIEIQSDRPSRHVPEEAVEVPAPPRMRFTVAYGTWYELHELKKAMQLAEGAPRKVTWDDVIRGLLRRPEK